MMEGCQGCGHIEHELLERRDNDGDIYFMQVCTHCNLKTNNWAQTVQAYKEKVRKLEHELRDKKGLE